MKRGRDDDDEPNKRPLLKRLLEMAKGKPSKERENAIQEHEEQLRQILEDELKAKHNMIVLSYAQKKHKKKKKYR